MEFQIKHKKRKQIITVYEHRSNGTYVNADNCTTEYKKSDCTKVNMKFK